MGECDKNTPLLEVKIWGKILSVRGVKGKRPYMPLMGSLSRFTGGKPLGLWERADAARPLQAESSTV